MSQMKKSKQISIKSLVIHYTAKGVLGLKTTYLHDGKDLVLSHVTKTKDALKVKILLEDDETIKSIKGYSEKWIHKLIIKTSTG